MSGVISELQKSIHEWAIRKEWRGPKATKRPLVADLMLFVSEIAEALEELRKNDDPHHVYFTYTCTLNGVKFKNLTWEQIQALPKEGLMVPNQIGKPEGVGPELADLAIRVLETCEEYGLDLAGEIARKMDYNEERETRHGGLLM